MVLNHRGLWASADFSPEEFLVWKDIKEKDLNDRIKKLRNAKRMTVFITAGGPTLFEQGVWL